MTELTVKSLAARAVKVPLEHPVKTSVGVVASAPLVLIDLATHDGGVGRAYLFTYTPLALEATRQMVLSLGQALIGQPLAPLELDTHIGQRLRLLGRAGIAGMASAGIDMAAWDALARFKGMPLVELLGGRRRPIAAYDSHSMDGEVLGVERARQAQERGFRAIKTKIGYASLQEDLQILRALRRAVGPEIEIMADYNQSLSIPEAVRRIRALEGEGISWIEEPTLQEDYAGHAAIRSKANIPIQMGENWYGIEEMTKALDLGACDLAMPDIMKIGGVTGWMRAAALAQARRVPLSSHIFQEFSAHLLCVSPTAHWLERLDLAGPVLTKPLAFQDGFAQIPDTPGVGLEWDEAAVERYLA